jgi:DNA-binding MurR/RpiR family transcriptional regulator
MREIQSLKNTKDVNKSAIAKKYKVSPSTVTRYLKLQGYDLHNANSTPEQKAKEGAEYQEKLKQSKLAYQQSDEYKRDKEKERKQEEIYKNVDHAKAAQDHDEHKKATETWRQKHKEVEDVHHKVTAHLFSKARGAEKTEDSMDADKVHERIKDHDDHYQTLLSNLEQKKSEAKKLHRNITATGRKWMEHYGQKYRDY